MGIRKDVSKTTHQLEHEATMEDSCEVVLEKLQAEEEGGKILI